LVKKRHIKNTKKDTIFVFEYRVFDDKKSRSFLQFFLTENDLKSDTTFFEIDNLDAEWLSLFNLNYPQSQWLLRRKKDLINQ